MGTCESLQHNCLKTGNEFRLVLCDIRKLAGVLLQIEEADVAARGGVVGFVTIRSLPFAGAKDEFMASRAHACFFILQILAEDVIARRMMACAFQIAS